jgi:hypothetical protein
LLHWGEEDANEDLVVLEILLETLFAAQLRVLARLQVQQVLGFEQVGAAFI